MPQVFYNSLTALQYNGLEADEYNGLMAGPPPVPPAPVVLFDSPAMIVAAYLTEGSGALFTEPDENEIWPLFVSTTPDGDEIPDNVGTIYDTAGRILHRYLKSGRVQQSFGIMIRARAVKYADAWRKLGDVATLLSEVQRQWVTLGSNSYVIDTIMQTSPVISAGQDQRRRALATVNFMVMLLDA